MDFRYIIKDVFTLRTRIDIICSPQVIEYMKNNHAEPDVVYEEGDVTALSYPTESFDIVVDKGANLLLIYEKSNQMHRKLY